MFFRAYLGGWSLKHLDKNYLFIAISQYCVQKMSRVTWASGRNFVLINYSQKKLGCSRKDLKILLLEVFAYVYYNAMSQNF